MSAGTGIVRKIGWQEKTEEEGGGKVFSAVVDFPDGPPDLPFNVVWNATPVRIVVDQS